MTLLSFSCHFQSLQKGFFNFDTFDVAEYEYYEVRTVEGGGAGRGRGEGLVPGYKYIISDFVTNSYGESRDSSCEKSWVQVHNQWVPAQMK